MPSPKSDPTRDRSNAEEWPSESASRSRSRPRYGRGSGSSRPSPIALGAIAVVLAGAGLLFWQRTGPVPTGIGEQMTVVTATQQPGAVQGSVPHSGEVDIARQGLLLTPERPDQAEAQSPPTKSETQSSRQETEPPPAQPRATEIAPFDGAPQPRGAGDYAVQVASFQDENNAREMQTRLSARGYAAVIQAATTADGFSVHRVWIGYFRDRPEAETYIRAHRGALGDAIPVSR